MPINDDKANNVRMIVFLITNYYKTLSRYWNAPPHPLKKRVADTQVQTDYRGIYCYQVFIIAVEPSGTFHTPQLLFLLMA